MQTRKASALAPLLKSTETVSKPSNHICLNKCAPYLKETVRSRLEVVL